jgi:hypothetical protein
MHLVSNFLPKPSPRYHFYSLCALFFPAVLLVAPLFAFARLL